MHFHFKTDFLYYENIQTETNCTLSLGLKSWKNFAYSVFLLSYQPQKNSNEFPQDKFVDWSFHFSSKRQLSIFFNFHFSFVYFIGAFQTAQERIFPEFASILLR